MPVLRTSNTQNALLWQQTLLTGGPVAVGDTFHAIAFPNAPAIRQDIRIVSYNDDIICAASADAQTYYFLAGDIAAAGDTLYSQRLCSTVRFDQPLPVLVGSAPEAEWYGILRRRFYRIPPQLLRLITCP